MLFQIEKPGSVMWPIQGNSLANAQQKVIIVMLLYGDFFSKRPIYL